MRNVIVFFGVLGMAFAFWVGTKLSADAIGVIVGVTFGVLASIPAAMLVMHAGRRNDSLADDRQYNPRQLPESPYQPPVIIFHSPAQLPAPPPAAQLPGLRYGDEPVYLPPTRRENWVQP